ncbi:MAG: hypothetical protein ACOYT4_03085 [Nanoarchaeota archaeon]
MGPGKKLTAEEKEFIKQAWEEGKTMRYIEKTLKRPHSTIYAHISSGFTRTTNYYKELSKRENGEQFILPSLKRTKKNPNKIRTRNTHSSHSIYQNGLMEKHQQEPKYQEISYLINAIKGHGISQEELVKTTGISRGTISYYSQGKVFPSQSKLEKLFLMLETKLTQSKDNLLEKYLGPTLKEYYKEYKNEKV